MTERCSSIMIYSHTHREHARQAEHPKCNPIKISLCSETVRYNADQEKLSSRMKLCMKCMSTIHVPHMPSGWNLCDCISERGKKVHERIMYVDGARCSHNMSIILMWIVFARPLIVCLNTKRVCCVLISVLSSLKVDCWQATWNWNRWKTK